MHSKQIRLPLIVVCALGSNGTDDRREGSYTETAASRPILQEQDWKETSLARGNPQNSHCIDSIREIFDSKFFHEHEIQIRCFQELSIFFGHGARTTRRSQRIHSSLHIKYPFQSIKYSSF